MHSTEYNEDIVFHHNGDYSGDVKIDVNLAAVPNDTFAVPLPDGATRKWLEIEIPFEALRRLVLNYLVSKKISQLEDGDYDQLEKILMNL